MSRYFLLVLLFFSAGLLCAQQNPNQHQIDSLQVVLKTTKDELKPGVLNQLAQFYGMTSLDTAENYASQALALAEELKMDKEQAQALFILGTVKYHKGNSSEALSVWGREAELYNKLGMNAELAGCYNRIGVCYKNMGKYDKAIEMYQRAANLYEKIGDKVGLFQTLANIGNFYYFYGENYDKALEYYEKSLKIVEEIDAPQGKANILNSMGNVYSERKDYDKAMSYYRQSLRIYNDLNDKYGLATTKNNLGRAYARKGEYDKGLNFCEEAVQIWEELGNKDQLASAIRDLGFVYNGMKRYDLALKYYKQTRDLFTELGRTKEAADIHRDISEVYAETGQYKLALDNYVMYSNLKDSIFKEDTQKQISEYETMFKTQEKEKALAMKEAQLQKQKNFRNTLMFAIGFLILLAFFIMNRYLMKRKANHVLEAQNAEITRQNGEIIRQNEEITRQKEEIERQKTEITDSIHYAQRIQKALLPPPEFVTEHLPDHFILFRPRDIVSGDFYWMTQKNNKIVVAAADCTGHGVPGAFMSMLGISFLNEIVNKMERVEAHQILNQLRNYVKTALRQTGKEGEAKDGMDIALCIIDKQNRTIQYSGAYNPLYLIRKAEANPLADAGEEYMDGYELVQVKADRMPIGIYIREKDSFSVHEFEVSPGDTLYLFSDGYQDQVADDGVSKFMAKRFKSLLLSIQDRSMTEQKEILEAEYNKWKGQYKQIDDVIVLGFKL